MSTRGRPATRTDVARLAGTSVAVVSYVINNGPRNVSPERRQRVLAAMQELDYQPNAIARSLTSTRTNTVGMIVPNISNAFFAELALAVEDAALEAGLLLFVGNSNEEQARERAYVDSFVRQRVDGAIIIGVARQASLQRLVDARIPTVELDRALDRTDVARVGIDHREAARNATVHLLEHGHTNVACITGPDDLHVAEERLRGWEETMRLHSLPHGREMIQQTPFSLEGGVAAFRQLDRDGDRPTAAFVASDEQARGLIAAAGEQGVRVPEDLALVSVDGTRVSEFSNPSITSMRQPYAELARTAVAALLEPESESAVLHATLHLGRSCGCAANDQPR